MFPLEKIIADEIRRAGAMTFARFMELALYHPQYGYYSTPQAKIGRAGDFYTAPSVSPLFGAMLARQIEEMWRLAGRPQVWSIVECGPGTGKLAGDIMEAIIQDYPDFYLVTEYHLIEISPGLKAQQQQTLAAHQAAARFNWPDSLAALNPNGFNGCVLANELVDAFPVHLVQQNNGRLEELFVALDQQDRFILQAAKPSTPAIAAYFEMQGIKPAEGRRAEVNLYANHWLNEVSRCLNLGFVLLIDYGAAAADLYSPHRLNGTIRSFHQHKLIADPLLNAGGQDITAHVNFTALIKQGQRVGLKPLGLITQPQFLINLGIFDTVSAHNDYTYNPEIAKKTMAIKQLVLPGGMGDIFKVLLFSRGFDSPPLLSGVAKNGAYSAN
ncbi:MAG: SAM-dependent methyltransferase [Firmicutes bacterium]|nr:SAM-dependent methyltransferase [Bacillota bacterium]